ncbi:DUF4188 domain-containing protein [Paenibacillus glucanolyticus]|jgi:hypothetical protein|uniref:Transcriptional regulator n=2 Tax=Paenibacillus glucanolyticus TaxID=59843 RepID=A0A163F4D0_9BACL|nr:MULTISPECIES: DUF4188 domain-containing protein [Paenibacillus]ANA78747.1 transcriptional regulator [Paenibacillus glucanolyticus]AVV57340.1 DUF4188 domain-containing protein [Paenibacillus glucanolyticus]AWP26496.1 transcriptional regulator [Paenibacillus sp. Cedars]ETT35244.1 hypothetical protein C169_17035 [Paenibacillus sp. FSL R5-808]KZS44150.1 transcriptional regulator [Paenibacillus glucanolyticus]
MSKVIPGRYTAHIDGPFVVFVIGMRINKWWSVHKWLPVVNAMSPMIQELYRNKEELGFLDGTFHLSWRGVTLIQYWRSFEHLEHYARHGAKHLTAWRDFNRKVGTGGDVGIFHESYLIDQGQYECVYNNMPRFGLAKAGAHVPATGRRETASRRLGREGEPAVPTPPNPPNP